MFRFIRGMPNSEFFIFFDRMDKKETVSLAMSVVLVTSGVVLSFISFFISKDHVIDDSVLWYFAQTLLYAGSVFGLKNYVDYKLRLPKK